MEPTATACWHHAMILPDDKLSSPDDKLRTQGESLTTGIFRRRCGQGQAAAAAPAAAGWLAARRHGAWLASTAYQHRLNLNLHIPYFAPLHLPAKFDKSSVLSPMQWRTGVNIVKHEVRFQPVPHRSHASAASLMCTFMEAVMQAVHPERVCLQGVHVLWSGWQASLARSFFYGGVWQPTLDLINCNSCATDQ